MLSKKSINEQKINKALAKYIKQGVWQDFTKYTTIKKVLFWAIKLIVVFTIIIGYAEYNEKNLHFVKEFTRNLWQIVFLIISYFIGRKHENNKIKEILDKSEEK